MVMIKKIILIIKKSLGFKEKTAKSLLFNDNKLSRKIFTVSNVLTFLRIAAVPFIVWGIVKQEWFFTFWLFLFAAITDLLDGYLARRWKESTILGAVLDPLADKIFIISLFAALVFAHGSLRLPVWFLIFIIVRELIIVFGAFYVYFSGKNLHVQPTIWGKLTTFFQALFIFWYINCSFFGWIPLKTFYLVLALLTIFSFFSLIHYVKIGFKLVRK